MIIFLLLSPALACKSIIKERSVFPTQGEYYQLHMDQIFSDQCYFFSCKGCVDDIQITNAKKKITQQQINYTFNSVISNATNFVGLVNSQIVVYKQFQNLSIDDGTTYDIPEECTCFNLLFYNINSILVDCYNNETLILYQFDLENFIALYTANSSTPLRSKFQLYFQEEREYILYAQYYKDYSILTVLNDKQQISNLSTLLHFVDFSASSNCIYISNQNYLYQYELVKNKLEQLTNVSFSANISFFYVYDSLKMQAQCDNLIIIISNNLFLYIGCRSQFFLSKEKEQNYLNTFYQVNIVGNEDFLLLTNDLSLYILLNDDKFEILQIDNSFGQAIIFFQFNILYKFGNDQYSVFNIQQPSLIINSTSQKQLNIKINGYLKLEESSINPLAQSNIHIQVLSPYETQLFVQYQKKQIIHYFEEDFQFEIPEISGSLLNFQPQIYNPSTQYDVFGYFSDKTINQIGSIQNQFQQAQIIHTLYYQMDQIPFYLYTSNQAGVYFSQCINNVTIKCSTTNMIPFAQSITNIQLGYNYQNQLIVGIQFDENQLQCLYQEKFNRFVYSLLQINVKQQIFQYLIFLNSTIILLNNSIVIYWNCQQEQNLKIDQQFINKQFNQSQNYSFNPINISSNVQYQSSILFINNLTSIIAVSVVNERKIIPISRIQIDQSQDIYGINQVGERLILSFFNNTVLNFQVWNFQNIFQPYFEKNLTQIFLSKLISITCDNLFFYVLFDENQLYIYNPYQSQHSTLYQNLTQQNQLMTSTSLPTKYYSYTLFGQDIFQIQNNNLFLFSLNQSSFITDEYPQLVYNFSVGTYLNTSSQLFTIAQYLVFLYNFNQIDPRSYSQNTQILPHSTSNQIQFTQFIPIDSTSQIASCELMSDFSCNQNLVKNNCSLDSVYFFINVESQLFLQNNIAIYSLNVQNNNCTTQQIFNYEEKMFISCNYSISVGQNLYSICENNTGFYWIEFQISNLNESISIQTIFQLQNLPNYQIKKFNSKGVILTNNHQTLFQCNTTNCSLIAQNCQDFIETNNIYILGIQYQLLLYISQNELFYQIINNMNNSSITNDKYNKAAIELMNMTKISFYEIVLISQMSRRIILFLKTNSSLNYFLEFRITVDENSISIKFLDIVRLMPQIPQYMDNLLLLYGLGSQWQDNYLAMYQNFQMYSTISFYNLTNLLDGNSKFQPILMLSQIEISYSQSQILIFNNKTQLFTQYSMFFQYQNYSGYLNSQTINLAGYSFTCFYSQKNKFTTKFNCSNAVDWSEVIITNQITSSFDIVENLGLIFLLCLILGILLIRYTKTQAGYFAIEVELKIS